MHGSDMSTADKLLSDILKERGYVEDFHKVLASEDPKFLEHYSEMWKYIIKKNSLGKKTTSLVRLAVVTAVGNETAIRHSMDMAAGFGASPKEILDTLKIVFMFTGVPTLVTALSIYNQRFES